MKKYLLCICMASLLSFTPNTAFASGIHKASWYGGYFHGRKTASGEVYNKYAMTAASNSHRMGTKLKVTNVSNGKSVIVKVNDTGGFSKYGRTLDLSQGAFQKIAPLSQGIVKVKIEVLN